MPLNPPAFSPPKWPRLGRRKDSGGYAAGLAPVPAEIPICWLTPPVKLRLEQPYTTASVFNDGFGTANDANVSARTEFGDFPFTATLKSACSADGANLASWTVEHQAVARMRSPELVIDLIHRTDAEKLMLLRLERFSRIRLTGTPPEFPEGANSLILAGVLHEIGLTVRKIRLTTRQVIGTTPGVPGPWFRFGHSSWGGTDVIPF